jgi:hypothetical protein
MQWIPSLRYQGLRQYTTCTRHFISPATRRHVHSRLMSPSSTLAVRQGVINSKNTPFNRPSRFGFATAVGLGLSFGVATALVGPIALLEREF